MGFTKKSSTLPCVVWAKEFKNGLGFEIRPSFDDIPTSTQLLTDSQSSCTLSCIVWVGEIKNGLGFIIGLSYDDVPTRSQLLTGRQSSCMYIFIRIQIDIVGVVDSNLLMWITLHATQHGAHYKVANLCPRHQRNRIHTNASVVLSLFF